MPATRRLIVSGRERLASQAALTSCRRVHNEFLPCAPFLVSVVIDSMVEALQAVMFRRCRLHSSCGFILLSRSGSFAKSIAICRASSIVRMVGLAAACAGAFAHTRVIWQLSTSRSRGAR